MKFIDLFAGIGGMRRGLELAGHECVGFCEWDRWAQNSYRAMHQVDETKEWFCDDIRRVDPSSLPRFDILCGGFPCQDISVAGKGRGFFKGNEEEGEQELTRSGLFFEIIRILNGIPQENKPGWVILENVKNLLSIEGGWGMSRVCCALAESGYNNIEYQLFNTKFSYAIPNTRERRIDVVMGIPQNRERVFLIARRSGTAGGRKVFPIPTTDGKDIAELQQIGRLRTATNCGEGGYQSSTLRDNPQRMRVYNKDGLAPALSCMQGGGLEPLIAENIPRKDVKEIGYGISAEGKKLQSSHVYDENGLAPTLTTGSGGNHQPCIIDATFPNRSPREYYQEAPTLRVGGGGYSVKAVLTPEREEKRQNGRRMKEDGEPMFTLTSQDRHGVAIQFTRKGDAKEVVTANTLVAATPKRALGNNSPITGVMVNAADNNGGGYK